MVRSPLLRRAPRTGSPLFFFNDTATTEIYTLSLHDALPICNNSPAESTSPENGWRWSVGPIPGRRRQSRVDGSGGGGARARAGGVRRRAAARSEEHTSELQSLTNLVCRLLLEKQKRNQRQNVGSGRLHDH